MYIIKVVGKDAYNRSVEKRIEIVLVTEKEVAPVTVQQISDATLLSADSVNFMRNTKETFLHYDEEDKPVLDKHITGMTRQMKFADAKAPAPLGSAVVAES